MEYKNKTIHLNSAVDNIFFTSDTHFSHKNIIEYCDRPFKTVEDMNSTMIKNWNSTVKEGDHIFVLGDFCFGNQQQWNWLVDALNGNKYLIKGNHDKSISGDWKKIDNIINLLIEDEEIKDGQRISLCHYPMLSWYQSHRGSWQLYGHLHSRVTTLGIKPIQYDVGVDGNNYHPIPYEEIKMIITKQCLK